MDRSASIIQAACAKDTYAITYAITYAKHTQKYRNIKLYICIQ
uniref:Uncharacterized protein n=1 Tax=viral metagenome TaxID=1070528 RepID=A0A6C0KUU7_9ZZZZ